MRLTLHTDYAMRVLLHLAARPEGLGSIAEIASLYGISRNHLMKVVQNLSRSGLVDAVRGRGGGPRLGRPATQITVGDVVRQTEDGFQLVDCGQCLIAGACELPPILNEAIRAFLAVLDSHTVADLLQRRAGLATLLGGVGVRPRARPSKAKGAVAGPTARTRPTPPASKPHANGASHAQTS